MSKTQIFNITSADSYLAVFKLVNGVLTKIKDGNYSSMRVNNGILQANQQLASSPVAYYYYIYPVMDLTS